MPIRYGIYDAEAYRRRLGIGVFISLLVHALILSLEFGMPGSGPPGLHASWGERRAQDASLHLRLAEVNKFASTVAEPATATGSASAVESSEQNSASDIGAVPAPNKISPTQTTGNPSALQSSRAATPSSLAILSDQENGPPISAAPPKSTPLVAGAKAGVKQRKARSKSGKQERRNTVLAKKNAARPSGAKSDQNLVAESSPQSDSFAIPSASETRPEQPENEAPAIQETAEDRRPVELAEDAPDSDEPLVAEPYRRSKPDPAQAEMTPTPQAADPVRGKALAEEQATRETQAQAEAARQQEEENARLAEKLRAESEAEENEKRQAMERESQRAEEEARRLAEQEQEERRAREAEQLAARETEEAARRAEIGAQRQAELLARQQAAQRLEEEARRREELAARMKAEEDAKHALAADEQRRAEVAAKEQVAERIRAESERQAHERAMQAQQDAAARQAEQAQRASVEAQERAQASAAQARAQAEEMIQRSSADQSTPGESRGSSAPAMPANASGTGSEERTSMPENEVPRPICPCFRCFKFKRSESEVVRTVCFCYRCNQKSRQPGRRQ